ncbi:hybrid sensor histidine kinase/response regulator [Thiosocius teredinicola]|uniref:hybrid sensor histidine kinase/response regulator n=1 Tax=Thiosocius teredinicola TaxID=1973002 RepID=UPI000990C106
MMPEMRQDRSGLRWIRGELDQNLREARNLLEDFVEGRQEDLSGCVDLLHHVHGALEMVQVFGGAMLADEMEKLSRAMSQGNVKQPDAAAEALMLGMVQLPSYLEKLEAGGADIPLALLPLMNDLRSAREAPLVSESSLFAPKLDSVIAADTVRPGSGNRDLPGVIKKLRSKYHRGLLFWIRGQQEDAALGQIIEVLDTVNSNTGTSRMRRLLDAGEALATALREDNEEPAIAVKPLFGKIDRVFKTVIDQGEESAMLDFPVDLLKNLLYYIARSSSTAPSVVAVKEAADLANSFPEHGDSGDATGLLSGPGQDMFEAVAEALAQDLRSVKDQLDLYIRGDRAQIDRLTALAQPIQRIGDTLGMVGRGELRTRLKHRGDELAAVENSGEPMADDRLMALASELLYVESSLSNLAGGGEAAADFDAPSEGALTHALSQGEMQQHLRVAVDEAMVELAKTKDAILEYLAKPENTELLNDVPTRLGSVGGVLRMLDLPEAGQLLAALAPYISELASGERGKPGAEESDALADVVISAETYMQSAVEPGADRERILAYAEDALAKLGLSTGESARAGVELSVVEGGLDKAQEAQAAEAEAEVEQVESNAPVEFEAPEATNDSSLNVVDEAEEQPALEAASDESDEIDEDVRGLVVEDADKPVETPTLEWAAAGLSVSSEPEAQAEEPAQEDVASEPEAPVAEQPAAAPVVEEEEIDPEILEVFAEEAEEELNVIQELYPKWRADQGDNESLATLRRSFHTLKGSGRIVGANNIGEFAWSVENLLNRVIDQTVATTPSLFALLDDVVDVLPTLVEESTKPGAQTDVSAISARAFAIASGEPEPAAAAPVAVADSAAPSEVETAPAAEPETVEAAPVAEVTIDEVPVAEESTTEVPVETIEMSGEAIESFEIPASIEGESEEIDLSAEPVPDESILTDSEAEDSHFAEADGSNGIDTNSLNTVFLDEAQQHLGVLADFIQRCRDKAGSCEIDEGVRRAMHTLRGSSRTAGVAPMAELAGALEDFSDIMGNMQRYTDIDTLDLLGRSHKILSDLVSTVQDPNTEVPGWQSLRDEINGLITDMSSRADSDSSARDDLSLEDAIIEQETQETVEITAPPLDETPVFEEPVAHEPAMQEPEPTVDEDAEPLDPELVEIFLEEANELLEALEAELHEWQDAAPGNIEPVAKLQRTLHTMKGGARLAGAAAVGDLSHAMESAFESITEQRIKGDERLKGLVRYASDLLAQDVETLVRGMVPAAHPEVIERLEAAAHGREWSDLTAGEPAAPAPAAQPEQEPTAQAPEAADAGMTVEEAESLEAPSELLQPESLLQEQGAADSQLVTDSQLLTDSELLGDSSFLQTQEVPAAEAAVARSTVVQFPSGNQLAEGEGFVPRRPFPEEEKKEATGSSGERVRVASETLDQMVNNAGEVSIYRARLEQQNSTFGFNLNELQATIDRLRGQLRDLEIETEAQVLSRHEREVETDIDFDPLEMDRYSTIQQLSRALSETVEDLSNLGQSLTDLSRDTDTLLLQQSRVTTDLQDALLRTRMVKFASRVPRLERVVRQTGHTVGKEARLDVVGGAEDMDRAILERMMGPLEHLMRNSVSHGIEDANARLANSKPREGVITLSLSREGTDVVLTLSDDGAGLDRARIRSKAVERGLIDADAVVEDDDLFQLILQPGFSTAQELSQVSGRGVGMDVVLTEVKQLGGTLDIESQPGAGTSFTIRLPFTLAITDALLVTLGDDMYAVPHSSMDGVVRIGVDELRAIYAGEKDVFTYDNRDYTVRYLGSMLGTQAPHIPEGLRWLPLLLVRSGEHRVAIHVDSLMGNRQIVVKSIGAQLSTVRWYTGGTILADGQIALILDVNALVRMDSAQHPSTEVVETAEPESKGITVMVVDDSITVRKVTSRLLERHNMHVVTAKDGVDAVTVLQDHRPDIMLLDIEMPRMDGYELARHMRSTPELADIPIIMITSRTGDKHRNRAMELGVKRYLGKPYQEAELLENIYTLLADTTL